MKSVRFLKSHRMYQPGEIAGFDDAFADKLITGGFAVPLGAKGALKTATADVLVNPADAVTEVTGDGADVGGGQAPGVDPVVPASTDPAAADLATVLGSVTGNVPNPGETSKDPSGAQPSAEAASSSAAKKSAGKKD